MTPDALLEFAEGLARVAAGGGGPTALVGHLARSMELGVMLEDAQWRPIATAGRHSLPPTANGLHDEAATVLPVAAGGPPTAWLSLFGGHAQRTECVPAARLTASAIAVEIARENGGALHKKRAFWDGVLSGAYLDLSAARVDAAARGIALADAYVCVALDRASDASDLRTVAPDAVIEVSGARVLLIPAPRAVDAEKATTAARLLKQCRGGISRAVSPLELAAGVREATSALAIVKRLYREPTVVTHADLGAYPLIFAGANVEELRALAARTLAPLRAYDEKHQTELERTLRRYFATGMNVKDTATDLNVHRHTVFYRLRQIADISGSSLESEHDQLTLRLAIAIDALHT